mmetsp:Transcript_12828/g.21848  ORF Transcript_12828/g.21848 Transcript_12828/m.21848 type:complete len:351 (-) Transcript_12828:673-1725(-)
MTKKRNGISEQTRALLNVGELQRAFLVMHGHRVRVDHQLGVDVARVAAKLVETVVDEDAIELGHATDLQRLGVFGRHVVAVGHVVADPVDHFVRHFELFDHVVERHWQQHKVPVQVRHVAVVDAARRTVAAAHAASIVRLLRECATITANTSIISTTHTARVVHQAAAFATWHAGTVDCVFDSQRSFAVGHGAFAELMRDSTVGQRALVRSGALDRATSFTRVVSAAHAAAIDDSVAVWRAGAVEARAAVAVAHAAHVEQQARVWHAVAADARVVAAAHAARVRQLARKVDAHVRRAIRQKVFANAVVLKRAGKQTHLQRPRLGRNFRHAELLAQLIKVADRPLNVGFNH